MRRSGSGWGFLNPPRNGEGERAIGKARGALLPASRRRWRGAHLSDGAGAETGDPSVSLREPPPRAGEDLPDELRVFDYIYGVLHSPDYRRTYAQFLKIDFPRIPYYYQ